MVTHVRTKVMRYLMKADFVEWSQLFDVIVVGARKPSFYLDTVRYVLGYQYQRENGLISA